MIYLLIGAVFIASCLVFFLMLFRIYLPALNVQYRLLKIEETYNTNMDLDDVRRLPFRHRIFYPVLRKIKDYINRLTPDGIRLKLEKELRAANYPFGLKVTGWLFIKFFFYFILPALFLVLMINSSSELNSKVLLSAAFIIICILLPNVIVKNRIKGRSSKVVRELPDALDLLTVSVEAGLSFDGALAHVAKKGRGELSKEFAKVLDEIQLGRTRREALIDMTERCDVPDLKVFISSMIQAEQLGVSIGKILRVQSDQMRDKRRQRAREQAMKIPVKMLFPLVFCIFPSIFIVILGPALIQIKEFFLSM